MKMRTTILLACLLAAACNAAPRIPQSSIVSTTPTLGPDRGPAVTTSAAATTQAVPPRRPGVSSNPLAITVQPPTLLLGPGSGTPAPLSPPGWLTYTSPALGAALDYPADWSVLSQADGATFTSPQGETVLLQPAGDSPVSPSETLQCALIVNAAGLTANTCWESASNRYSATFIFSSGGSPSSGVVLSTTDAAAVDIYKYMLNSVRELK